MPERGRSARADHRGALGGRPRAHDAPAAGLVGRADRDGAGRPALGALGRRGKPRGCSLAATRGAGARLGHRRRSRARARGTGRDDGGAGDDGRAARQPRARPREGAADRRAGGRPPRLRELAARCARVRERAGGARVPLRRMHDARKLRDTGARRLGWLARRPATAPDDDATGGGRIARRSSPRRNGGRDHERARAVGARTCAVHEGRDLVGYP